jgi:hypothetical protein
MYIENYCVLEQFILCESEKSYVLRVNIILIFLRFQDSNRKN